MYRKVQTLVNIVDTLVICHCHSTSLNSAMVNIDRYSTDVGRVMKWSIEVSNCSEHSLLEPETFWKDSPKKPNPEIGTHVRQL